MDSNTQSPERGTILTNGHWWLACDPKLGSDGQKKTILTYSSRLIDLVSMTRDCTSFGSSPAEPLQTGRPRPGAHTLPPFAPAARPRPDACASRAPHDNLAHGQPAGAQHALLSWRRMLEVTAPTTQKDLPATALEARRARVYADLSGWGRTGRAAVQGGRAALWLTAVPSACGCRGSIPCSAMRVAVRLWLRACPRPDPPRSRCSCGGVADAGGRHFLSLCPAQVAQRTAVHHLIVSLVAAALRRAPRWGAVVAETPLDGSDGTRRPDLRATDAAAAAVTWADVSVAWPGPDAVAAQVRMTPLRAVAAAAREARKRATYVPALPAGPPPNTCAPHTTTPNICASQRRRLHWPFVRVLGWPWKIPAIDVQTTPTVCVHDATTWCGGCKPTGGVPPSFLHPNHAACAGYSCAYLGGHRSIWPWKSKPRLRSASTPRTPCVEGANRRRGSPQHSCIPTTPLALAIRPRTWVAMEESGQRCPNHAYGMRPRRDNLVWRMQTDGGRHPSHLCITLTPLALAIRARSWVAIGASGHGSSNDVYGVRSRRDHRVWRVQTDGGGPLNICASQPRRLHWPFVRILGWP